MTEEPVTYCPDCTCDMCQKRMQDESARVTLGRSDSARCWTCSCGWIGCYTPDDIVEYGEPSECGRCYRERLSEADASRVKAALSAPATRPDPAILAAVEAERERCAKVAESFRLPGGNISDWINVNESAAEAQRRLIAAAIRSAKEGDIYTGIANSPTAMDQWEVSIRSAKEG